MKNIRIFLSENFQFLEVKFSLYLNRCVFIMDICLNWLSDTILTYWKHVSLEVLNTICYCIIFWLPVSPPHEQMYCASQLSLQQILSLNRVSVERGLTSPKPSLSSLTLTTLWANSAENKLIICSQVFFSRKQDNISCWDSWAICLHLRQFAWNVSAPASPI